VGLRRSGPQVRRPVCAPRSAMNPSGVKDLAAGLSQQPTEAGDSLIRGTPVRAEAVLTKPGRVGTARRRGFGERDEKAYERNQCVKLRKRRADSNLADLGRSAAHIRPEVGMGDSEAGMDRPVRRPRGRSAAYSWRGCRGLAGRLPRRSVHGERGNHPRSPSRRSGLDADGQARSRPMTVEWGGGLVVVRARERRVHGEGDQQARRADAGMPGVRR
jgi:hypothetical protein